VEHGLNVPTIHYQWTGGPSASSRDSTPSTILTHRWHMLWFSLGKTGASNRLMIRIASSTSTHRSGETRTFLHQLHIVRTGSDRSFEGSNRSILSRGSSRRTRLRNSTWPASRSGEMFISMKRRRSGESHRYGMAATPVPARTLASSTSYRYLVSSPRMNCHSGAPKTDSARNW
jgi:hypothetical protein